MEDLDRIYDAAFFAEWGRSNQLYLASAWTVANAVADQFRPRRVVDLGCGCAVYAHMLAQRGVETVNLDGVLAPEEARYPFEVHLRDLTRPVENEWGAFDLALCLEVAEHIPEADLPVFLANVTGFSDTLLLSAAPPDQGGHHHVNERPRRYWVRKLKERGFAYDRPATGRLCERLKAQGLPYMWMALHLCVYRRATDPRQLEHGLPFDASLG